MCSFDIVHFQFFGGIIEKLLVTTNRQDGNQENLRNAAYEAIMELMKNAPDDCYDIVLKVSLKYYLKLIIFLRQQRRS